MLEVICSSSFTELHGNKIETVLTWDTLFPAKTNAHFHLLEFIPKSVSDIRKLKQIMRVSNIDIMSIG